jgi:hypothetical protein
LKEHEAGVSVADLYRKHGVSDAIGGKVNGNKTKPPRINKGGFFHTPVVISATSVLTS